MCAPHPVFSSAQFQVRESTDPICNLTLVPGTVFVQSLVSPSSVSLIISSSPLTPCVSPPAHLCWVLLGLCLPLLVEGEYCPWEHELQSGLWLEKHLVDEEDTGTFKGSSSAWGCVCTVISNLVWRNVLLIPWFVFAFFSPDGRFCLGIFVFGCISFEV